MAKQLDRGRVATAEKRRSPEPEPIPEAIPAKRGKGKLILFAAVIMVAVLGAGGGYFFFMPGSKTANAAKEVAPPQPFFVEIKPFVITVKAADDTLHYIQLALSLKVPNEEAIAGTAVIMPELQDMIRQEVLAFKMDDLQSKAGVNELRARITAGANNVLLVALGKQKLDKLGAQKGKLVSNVYFQNLVIE